MKNRAISILCALVLLLAICAPTQAQGDAASPEATPEPKYKTYKLDDNSSDIKAIQIKLTELEYLHSKPDGWFGEKTRSAVRRFQIVNGLEVTGIADDQTQRRLFSEDALMQEPVLMSLSDLKKMMGEGHKLGVSYNLEDMKVSGNTASAELNNYVTIHCNLIGDDVTQITLSGKDNVKIPFTLMLASLDKSIDSSNIFSALDELIEAGDKVVDGKQIRYEVDGQQVQQMIITPEIERSEDDE